MAIDVAPDGTRTKTCKLSQGSFVLKVCGGTTERTGEKCRQIARKGKGFCKFHEPGKYVPVRFRTDEKLTAHNFIFNYVVTLDPHDKKRSVKPLPKHPFISKLIDLWLEHDLLLVVKSRQMLASWLFVALHLWDALVHDGRSIFFVSKKEEDAGFGNDLSLLSRAKFILDHLPKELRVNFSIKLIKIPF